MPMKNPPHIGGFIRRQVIEPLRLTVTDAAAALGVTRQALNNLLNEKASLTAGMAVRIEKAFGPKADHLMRMQLDYDLAQARRREGALKVRRVASLQLTDMGRDRVRQQALSDLAAARTQRRAGGRAPIPMAARQSEIIARVVTGEMTAVEAAGVLKVELATIAELVDQASPLPGQPPTLPRPPTGTR